MNFNHLLNSLIAIINEMSPYILLGFFIAGLLHVFVSPAAMSRHLSGKGVGPVIKAALFGIPLPLCSCGVLPAAVSLRRNGASRGATTSFLIATPQTGVDSITATYSLLGLPFAIIRPVAALIGSVAGGWAVSKVVPEESNSTSCIAASSENNPRPGFFRGILEAMHYGFVDMVASVGKWLVIGLIVAALITVFVPDSLFTGLSRYPILAMLVVVAVAIPMYICATGSIPVALSLMLKGLSPGIAFVMLMAGPAANFASIILLSKTQGKKATAIYVGSVVATAMAFGLVIDYFLPASWFVPSVSHIAGGCCHVEFGWFETTCSIILILLLIYSLFIKKHHHSHNKTDNNIMTTTIYKVKGMACAHCKATVEKAIAALPGVESVEADLSKATATVNGNVDKNTVINAIQMAGFEYIPD